MQRSRRDDDLESFLEFCNLPSDSQVDLNFPDDVLSHAQGDPLQNNGSLENRNPIQNPNPFFSNLNPNQNQEQQRDLFSPFANMHFNPHPNNLTEPWRRPYLQPNPELCMPSVLTSNRNQDMARPPCQTNTNVASNIASTSRGETSISHPSRKRGGVFRSIQTQSTGIVINRPSCSGIENSSSESVQQNIEGFVRNTRMRLDLGQTRTSMGTVSPGTAQYTGFPRPNLSPGQPMAFRALASNTLPNALAGGAFVPRVGTNRSPLQIMPATTTAPAPAPGRAARVTSQSQYTANEAIPVTLPLSHRQRAQSAAVPAPVLAQPALVTAQRTVWHQQPIRAIVSPGASEIRSQGVFVDQAVPALPSVPASSAVYVVVPNDTASTSQTGNGGALVVQETPRSLPLIRTRPPGGTSNAAPIRYREPRVYHQVAGRQIEMLLITEEMLDEWRQIDRHHDMRLDTDNMSFEELVALEERIGTVNTGVSEQTVHERMRRMPFSDLLEKDSEPCCICQEEYVETDEVGTLDCGHNFHTECIKKWLAQKNICPICKMPGIKP